MTSPIGDKSTKSASWRGIFVLCASAIALTACASSGPKVTMVKKVSSKTSTEYFSEKDYGVKASPRVVDVALQSLPGMKMKRLPRGGGRDQIGKPYKVKGKWYYPKEDQDYRAAGTASWYGDAFHGRLTANGEIYDMNHLSAAHPTMPLPSYARVTNNKNGNSVIVRVNDRGPYAHGRLIDLSKRAAQLLDYTSSGTAQVTVEYVGRAPVDGADDEYLMASYRAGTGNPAELSPGIMVASNEISSISPTLALAGNEVSASPAAVLASAQQPFDSFLPASADGVVEMPNSVPLPSSRPEGCLDLGTCANDPAISLLSGYADQRVATAHKASAAFAAMELGDYNGKSALTSQAQERILVGIVDAKSIKGLKSKFSNVAEISIETDEDGVRSVFATPRKGNNLDGVLKLLWKSGFEDAFVVR